VQADQQPEQQSQYREDGNTNCPKRLCAYGSLTFEDADDRKQIRGYQRYRGRYGQYVIESDTSRSS